MSDSKSGTDPPASTMRVLRRLLEQKQNAESHTQAAADALALEVFRVRSEHGTSARRLAAQLGVGPSTVHGWTRHGRRLAGD